MRKTDAKLAILLLPVFLAACGSMPAQQPGVELAAQPAAAATATASSSEAENLRTVVTLQDRLYRVAAPLLSNNTELCKAQARNLLGFSAKNRFSFSDDYAEVARLAFGFEDRLQVTDVLAGSGAARAGVRRGDILVAVEDKPLPTGANATRQAAGILAPLVAAKNSVSLSLLRGGQAMKLNVPLTRACGFGIELGNADSIAAYGDGRRVLVTRGMLRFVRGDTELSYVLAREMAHNILGHQQKQKTAVAADNMIDNLIRMHPDAATLRGTGGIKPMPQDYDAAADSLALYLVARAGYRIDGAQEFWSRMARDLPPSVTNGYTALHPATLARLAAIDEAAAAIREKQAAKKPLLP